MDGLLNAKLKGKPMMGTRFHQPTLAFQARVEYANKHTNFYTNWHGIGMGQNLYYMRDHALSWRTVKRFY